MHDLGVVCNKQHRCKFTKQHLLEYETSKTSRKNQESWNARIILNPWELKNWARWMHNPDFSSWCLFHPESKKNSPDDGRTHELQSSCAHNCLCSESVKQRFSIFKRLNPELRIHGNCGCGIFPPILRYDHLQCYLLHTHQFFALIYTTKYGENNLFLWYKRIKSSSSQLGVIVPL